VGPLSFTIALNIKEVRRRVAAYREAIKEAEPVGAFVNDQAAVFTLAHCAETTEQAEREAADGIMFYNRTQIEQLATMASEFAKHNGYEYYEKFVGVTADKFTFDYLQSNQLAMVRDPDQCREVAAAYRDIGVDQVLLQSSTTDSPTSRSCARSSCSARRCCPPSPTSRRRPAQRRAPGAEHQRSSACARLAPRGCAATALPASAPWLTPSRTTSATRGT
jgi:hypothetical protein